MYRVDRFDYLGECDRFPGVIISVGMKKEYPVQKDTLSYIAMFETLISPVFQFRYSLSNGERSLKSGASSIMLQLSLFFGEALNSVELSG